MVYSSLTSSLPADGIRSLTGLVVEVINTVILLLLLIRCHRYSRFRTSMVYSSLTSLLPGEGIRGLTGLVVGTVFLAAILQVVFRLIGLIMKRRREDEALKDFPGPPRHWLWGNLRDVSNTIYII